MSNTFEKAFQYLLKLEGGFSDHAKDKGGKTKFGISQKSYPELDIPNLTIDDARRIYYVDFWVTPKIDRVYPYPLAAKLFALAVLVGPERAIKLLQEACNLLGASLVVDGVLGDKTLFAVNTFRYPNSMIAALENRAGNYAIGLKQREFLAGWLARIDAEA